jgi:ATP-dependent RNA helicase RhlE
VHKGTIVSTFSVLGVAEPILQALAGENYRQPTPIQAAAVPLILAGRDVVGVAQTGTGKTAAFGVPLLQRLASIPSPSGPRSVRALILAPTRELAIQIHDSLRVYGRNLSLRPAVIVGGVSQSRQVETLRRGVDVLVATPGRLLDLMNQKHVALGSVEILVIDEADRMFDMGFIRDVRRIVSHIPRRRQALLFSATMPGEVAHLVSEVLVDPVRIDISPSKITTDRIDQRVHFVATQDKRSLLLELLLDEAMKRVIVFTRTKHGANRIATVLHHAGHSADVIHGNKSQNARQRALDDFRAGRSRILVATDIAARGLDIDDVTHVINLDIPDVAETYVHRIGRTARVANDGVAISLCDSGERDALRAIERLLKRPLAVAGNESRVSHANPAARTHQPSFHRAARERRHPGKRRTRRAA